MSRISETPQRPAYLTATYVPRSKERLRQLIAEREGPPVSRKDFLRAQPSDDVFRRSQLELPSASVKKRS